MLNNYRKTIRNMTTKEVKENNDKKCDFKAGIYY
jgi:hypothetical protein